MSDISVQTSLRQAMYTSVVTIIAVAVLALILEVVIGNKPSVIFDEIRRNRDGAQQFRVELALLGKALADDPEHHSKDMAKRMSGMKESMARGIALMEEAGGLPETRDSLRQLKVFFREQFLPDFLNFQHPFGDQDRSMIVVRLKASRDELESRLGVLERTLVKRASKDFEESRQIKFMSAVGGCILGAIGLTLVVFQSRSLQKSIAKVVAGAAPSAAADPKLSENVAKYAMRIRELESSNQTLRLELDKLVPLADEVVTLRQQANLSPWESWLVAIHSRARSRLTSSGRLAIELEVTPVEIEQLEGPLREHTEFTRSDSDDDGKSSTPTRHTVLVVEADPPARAKLLSCVAGLDLEVIETSSLEEAWSKLNGGVSVRLILVGVRDDDAAGPDFAQKVRADARFRGVEVILCSPLMDPAELTQNIKAVAESPRADEVPEKVGINTHVYGKMIQAVNTETAETLTFARTALSMGQRNSAWNRINSLRDTAAAVGDRALNNAIASVERELDRGDVFFITTELERLERENERLSKLAQQLLVGSPKTMSPKEIGALASNGGIQATPDAG